MLGEFWEVRFLSRASVRASLLQTNRPWGSRFKGYRFERSTALRAVKRLRTVDLKIMMYTWYVHVPIVVFLHIAMHCFSSRCVFFAFSAAGHAGGLAVRFTQVSSPAGLRGARSGRSKSRQAGSFRGIAFRRVRDNQATGNPQIVKKMIFALC